MSEPSTLAKIGAASYYGSASFLVQIINKSIFTGYRFPFPLLVALLQLAFMSPVCYFVAKPKLELRMFLAVVPLALVNVTNVVSGLISTGGLSVPMFIVLRRFSLVFTLILEKVFYKKRHSSTTHLTVTVMMLGAVLAALTDLTFSFVGYTAVFINDVFTALYLVLMKNVKELKDLTSVGLIFYNSTLSLPFLLLGFFASGEYSRLGSYSQWNAPGLQIILCATSVLGLTIHHSTFLCTRVNEPIMTMVTGQLKNMLSTVIGAIFFEDFVFAWANVIGLIISMLGAIWYAAHGTLKSQNRMESLAPKPLETNGLKNHNNSDKLKNYLPLSQSDTEIKIVSPPLKTV